MASLFLNNYKYKYLWIVLGAVSLVINRIMTFYPYVVDRFYFRVVFQFFRAIYDHTLGYIPIPMVYISLIFFIVFSARMFTTIIQNCKSGKWKFALVDSLLQLSAFLGGAIFFFYSLWGFNYNRPNIYAELRMKYQEIDSSYLIQEIDLVTKELILTREKISTDSLVAIGEEHIPIDLEGIVRENLEALLESWDVPTFGRVRVRKLLPKGILLRFSTAGVYIPYALEGHIDGGLHPIQWPFTMAHEMTHGYGYGDEGTCNFIGYLACIRSDNNTIRYSAIRAYWRYLMSDLRKLDKELYRSYLRRLPLTVKTDLNEIIEYMDRYPDIMPKVRDKVYDTYLKSNGVKAGLANYGHMIKYIKAYKEIDN